MITKLKLTNFKNFRRAEIALGPFSVLVGVNAGGKSNIRDALRFLHGVARGYNLAEIIGGKYGEGGQLAWREIRGGPSEICFHGEREFTLGVDFELYPERRKAQYRFLCVAAPTAPRHERPPNISAQTASLVLFCGRRLSMLRTGANRCSGEHWIWTRVSWPN